jgi:hypothetical protein
MRDWDFDSKGARSAVVRTMMVLWGRSLAIVAAALAIACAWSWRSTVALSIWEGASLFGFASVVLLVAYIANGVQVYRRIRQIHERGCVREAKVLRRYPGGFLLRVRLQHGEALQGDWLCIGCLAQTGKLRAGDTVPVVGAPHHEQGLGWPRQIRCCLPFLISARQDDSR